jgi:glc operon protein GlcG
MRILIVAALFAALGGVASAQQPPPAYGMPIALADARKIVDAALADAERQNLQMAVAVVDWSGNLTAFARADNTQTASIAIALGKARSAAGFRRPSKAFEDALVGGRMAILALEGAVPVEGGVLILREGRIVGAVGVSGGTAQQDGVVAAAGVAALR